MKPKWMTAASIAALSAACFASPAAAQLASPQWSRPAMDSTHVTGTAQSVMPEAPARNTNVSEQRQKTAPSTIKELLAAFDGVVLELPGRQGAGGFGQMRFRFTPDRMQTQLTANWQWYDSCSANDLTTRCVEGDLTIMLSPEGLFVIRQGCKGLNGTAGGSAEFRWADFLELGGLNGAAKHWTLQRDTFWSNCSEESGSND